MKSQNILFAALVIILSNVSVASAQLLGTPFQAHYIQVPSIELDAEKIAILNFVDETEEDESDYNKNKTSDGGGKIVDYMISALIKKDRGLVDKDKLYFSGLKTNLYTVVERSQLQKVIEEQNLAVSGAIDDATATEVGKLLGIDVIITGSINNTSTFEKEQYTSLLAGEAYKITRTMTVDSRIKIIDISTGEILVNSDFTSTSTSEKINYDGRYPSESEIDTEEKLKTEGLKKLANLMVSYFSPGYIYESKKIVKIKTKEYKATAKEAKSYLTAGRIDKAILIYTELYEQDPYNAAFAYNIGIVNESTGNFAKAKELIGLAYEIDDENSLYKEASKRINNTIQYLDYLSTRGITITPYTFDDSGSKVANKVKTRGTRKLRFPVYSEKSEKSDVVVNVPGDLSFEVLEDGDTWVKIKLVGGKEGYIQRKNLN